VCIITEDVIPSKYSIQFKKYFGSLLKSGNNSDVTLMVDAHEFKAHKFILSARSSVFAAMFEHPMKENEENSVQIEDIETEDVNEMLQFIYTGTAPNLKKRAKSLLLAADKYDLQTLKLLCEKELSSTLSIETALGYLIFADKHSAKKLRMKTIQFIIDNKRQIIKTEDWSKMKREQSWLLAELFEAFANI
jgi:hypothetical protein